MNIIFQEEKEKSLDAGENIIACIWAWKNAENVRSSS
jgi:hypothetical protein